MSLVSLLQTRYGWTPNFRLVYKKPAPQALKTFKVPQTTGIPGWIVLTYENNIPVCLWITAQECRKIPCIVDERLCGDTFLRVEKTGPLDFVVSDIWMFNSNCVFAGSTFEQRYVWLKGLLSTFTRHIKGAANLIHKSDLKDANIRGYELYTNTPGENGYFQEKEDPIETVTVHRLAQPDCYDVGPGRGYLRVPNLATSVHLRTKGDVFQCKCKKHEDDSWTLMEDIRAHE